MLTTPTGASSQTPRGRGSRNARGGTPSSVGNRSFNHESGIFGQAAIDESADFDDPDLPDIPEERSDDSEPFPLSMDAQLEQERQALEALVRQRLDQARAARGNTDFWAEVTSAFQS